MNYKRDELRLKPDVSCCLRELGLDTLEGVCFLEVRAVGHDARRKVVRRKGYGRSSERSTSERGKEARRPCGGEWPRGTDTALAVAVLAVAGALAVTGMTG